MPARDGTGPLGQGPRSGRGLGNCNPKRQSAVKTSPQTISTFRPNWFGQLWGNTFSRVWGRGRRNRMFWK